MDKQEIAKARRIAASLEERLQAGIEAGMRRTNTADEVAVLLPYLRHLEAATPAAPPLADALAIGKAALAAAARDGSGLLEEEFAERVGRAVLAARPPAAPRLEPLGELAGGADENPVAVVFEVLNDWLDENEASDFDENDVASFFGMLGTAGYSIVPNAAARPAAPAATAGAGEPDYADPEVQHNLDMEAAQRLHLRGYMSPARLDETRRRIASRRQSARPDDAR